MKAVNQSIGEIQLFAAQLYPKNVFPQRLVFSELSQWRGQKNELIRGTGSKLAVKYLRVGCLYYPFYSTFFLNMKCHSMAFHFLDRDIGF